MPSSFLSVISPENKPGVPVSKTATLIGDTADGGTVCNEGLSLEHWGETAVTHQRGKLI